LNHPQNAASFASDGSGTVVFGASVGVGVGVCVGVGVGVGVGVAVGEDADGGGASFLHAPKITTPTTNHRII
jgi:hypothetical protein